ncbi:MAG: LysE family translocator [Enterobacteriaceae bacterium]
MFELIAVATITILAVISPGADFAMVTRNSLIYGRSAGLFSSLGIAFAVQLHVFYTLVGVGLIIGSSPTLFMLIRGAGALYLIYIGYQTFVSKPAANSSDASASSLSALTAFKNGFFTNALNPKTTMFVVSVYTQVVNPETPLLLQISYGLFMSFAHWVWFSLVALFLSKEGLRNRLLQKQQTINRTIGILLTGLGIWLALTAFSFS